jgi:hypothetical protein
MEKFQDQINFRCKAEDRAELKRVSDSLGLAESDVARVAFKVGLKGIRENGLRPVREETRVA